MKMTKLASLALVATLVPAVPAMAQDADPFGDGKPFNIDFRGGSIGEFILYLREVAGGLPNIIVPDAAAHVQVPHMTLRHITITDLTAALNEVGRTGTDNEQFGLTRTTDNVWTVVAPKAKKPGQDQHVLFFPISQHIENHSIDDISTTIATAWEMLELPNTPTAHIKFHEDTKLLIASGSEQMLMVVQDALQALQADGKSAKEKKLQTDLEKAQMQLRAAHTDATIAAQMNQERSMVIQDDLRKNIEELREENSVLRAKLRDLESLLAASRSKK